MGFVEDSRRWDSARRRWRARSFLRFAASERSSSSAPTSDLLPITGVFGVVVGGFEFLFSSQRPLVVKRYKESDHVCFELVL
jgi:hypothetical protein